MHRTIYGSSQSYHSSWCQVIYSVCGIFAAWEMQQCSPTFNYLLSTASVPHITHMIRPSPLYVCTCSYAANDRGWANTCEWGYLINHPKRPCTELYTMNFMLWSCSTVALQYTSNQYGWLAVQNLPCISTCLDLWWYLLLYNVSLMNVEFSRTDF